MSHADGLDPRRRLVDGPPVLLDAAMGTRLVALGLDLAGDDPCLWNLSRPEAVLDIHRRDLHAGADAILTNTFGANRAWLGRLGRAADLAPINRRAADLARRAAGPHRLVVGCLGGSAVADAREQAEILAESGVDALVLETYAPDDALAALGSLAPLIDAGLPVAASLWAWPARDSLPDLAHALQDAGARMIGFNCIGSPGLVVELAGHLARASPLPVWVKPSLAEPGRPGLPAESWEHLVRHLLEIGVHAIGGCCGSTEAHIDAARRIFDDARHRQTSEGTPPLA